jgi:hypothetical protein
VFSIPNATQLQLTNPFHITTMTYKIHQAATAMQKRLHDDPTNLEAAFFLVVAAPGAPAVVAVPPIWPAPPAGEFGALGETLFGTDAARVW